MHRLLSFLLATVVDIGLLTVSDAVSDAKVIGCAITYRIDVNALGVNNICQATQLVIQNAYFV